MYIIIIYFKKEYMYEKVFLTASKAYLFSW